MKLFWTTLLPSLILAILMGGSAQAVTYTCSTCNECNNDISIASSGDIVQLTANINNQVGSCISFGGKDNLTFDCLGNNINGTRAYGTYGIWLNQSDGGSNNNTIRNCNVTNFYYGLYFFYSSDNNLTNITASSNSQLGIYLGFGSNNNTLTSINANSNYRNGLYLSGLNATLVNITAAENNNWDIYLDAAVSDSYCSNTISNVTGSGNRPIKYFNSSVNLSNETLSELILCNADNSNVTNVTIIGSDSLNNNGILMLRTDNSNLTSMNSSYNYYGLYLGFSSNNTLTNLTVNSNSMYGIYFVYGSNNTLTNITANSNSGDLFSSGIYLYVGSSYNTLDTVTANFNRYGIWLHSEQTKYNTLTNITANSNSHSGIYFWNWASGNTIVNLTANSNSVYGIELYDSSKNTFTDITTNYNGGIYSLNTRAGIYVGGQSWSNTIVNATVSGNQQKGIYLSLNVSDSIIRDSRITNNSEQGIFMDAGGTNLIPRYNTIYNNYLNNSVNFGKDESISIPNIIKNYWNTTKDCTKTNIIGGPCIGGNYWTNSGGTGFSDTCADSNSDGICDSPSLYTPATNNTDYLPLYFSGPDIIPPSITFISATPPNNTIVQSNYIEVNVSLSETPGTCILKWYSGTWTNYTMTVAGSYCYRNMTSLPDYTYQFMVYANDTLGNMNVSEMRQNFLTYLPPPLPSSLTLVMVSAETIHVGIGTSALVKTYVKNPDPQFVNITVWLGGDYPTSLAKFSAESGLYLTPDQRNLTVGLNPKEERVVTLVILSTAPKDGGYTITLNANTTASSMQDFDYMKIFIDYPPNFPGLELWGILLILAVSGLVYWKIKK
ncbi:MAG: right-handed parallel beta-helix repeat-containing protein [Candidatus Aenigmarchaeota archaeon]|nr:right-handed parallel beta-helix repeat-containing protein [Candidatus Aenigmarchaeota archaeon]